MYDRMCEYQGKKYYSFVERENKIRIFDYKKEKGFKNAIENGKIQKDLFYKDVKIENLTTAYLIKYTVEYHRTECIPMAIDKGVIKRGKVSIITENYDFAEKNKFRRFDVMSYIKEIPIDEVECLNIEMEPLYNKSVAVIYNKVNFKEYILNLE